jgi:hypothetical protein
MALTEDRILVSFEINVAANSIGVLWKDRILRDGVVISEFNHRGAYGLVAGELPADIQQLVGSSLHQFTSAAVDSFYQEVVQLRSDLATAIAEKETILVAMQQLHTDHNALQQEKQHLLDDLADSSAAILDLEETVTGLRNDATQQSEYALSLQETILDLQAKLAAAQEASPIETPFK